MEEFATLEVRPLLPYLFFDEASPALPARYASLDAAGTDAFRVDSLHSRNALEMYYHLLDIVGSRLREHPAATLRVTGCNAGTGPEQGNLALSRARAETVAEYLTGVWGIDRARIAVDARELPESPSRGEDADGAEENRRVELRADDDAILDPIVTRSVERRITPDIIRFTPTVFAEAGVDTWRLDVWGGDEPLRDFSGAMSAPDAIDWHFADDLGGRPEPGGRLDAGDARSGILRGGTLRYRLAARDSAGQIAESEVGSIEVRQITVTKKRAEQAADRLISRFNLILFDFDSPQLGRRNEQILARFILPEIGPGAHIRIAGYTDRIGEEKHNRTLSQQRAESAQRALRTPVESVEGKGENAPLYTNGSPEGRFYNRTVVIEAETDIKR
jgi:outer membrane protein OmpA-like peptidoglycan-associated protein